MSDEKALLGAIWEHPHEDTPRLMYADWLQEHGQPERAEFIRVQCERARLEAAWEELPAALIEREEELWKKRRTKWRAPLPQRHRACSFHRGFPMFQLRHSRFDDLLKLTVADLELAPLSRSSAGWRGQPLLNALKWPGLRFLTNFDLSSQLPRGWVKKVAACDNLRNVSELNLSGCRMKPAELRLLLDVWADRHLSDFRLPQVGGDEELAVLASHPTAAKIRTLLVSDPNVTQAGIRSICSSRHLTQLRSLRLHTRPIGDAGLKELLHWRRLSGLRELQLYQMNLTDTGAAALAACPALGELRSLSLMSNSIDADGCLALARSPHLNELTSLWLDDNPGTRRLAVRKELRARFGEAVDWS